MLPLIVAARRPDRLAGRSPAAAGPGARGVAVAAVLERRGSGAVRRADRVPASRVGAIGCSSSPPMPSTTPGWSPRSPRSPARAARCSTDAEPAAAPGPRAGARLGPRPAAPSDLDPCAGGRRADPGRLVGGAGRRRPRCRRAGRRPRSGAGDRRRAGHLPRPRGRARRRPRTRGRARRARCGAGSIARSRLLERPDRARGDQPRDRRAAIVEDPLEVPGARTAAAPPPRAGRAPTR